MGQLLSTTVFLAAALTLPAPSAPAQSSEPASYQDLRDLQYDLENLDESLRNVDTRDSRYTDLQDRVDRLREDVSRLERQIRAHTGDGSSGYGATRDEVSRLRREASTLQRDITRSIGGVADPRPAAAERPPPSRATSGGGGAGLRAAIAVAEVNPRLKVAVVSKVIGCGGGARLVGFNNNESLRLGVCMISRGEVGLIIASIGLGTGVFGGDNVLFPSLFLVILLTTVLTPPLVRWVFRDNGAGAETKPSLAGKV